MLAGRRNTIDYWARRGIVARAIVLDLARVLAASGREYRPGSATAFTVENLELARATAGVSYSPGCVVLLHTGFLGWYTGLPYADRAGFARDLRAPGVEHTEEMARYLWDGGLTAIAADTFAVEVWPADFGPQAYPRRADQILLGPPFPVPPLAPRHLGLPRLSVGNFPGL